MSSTQGFPKDRVTSVWSPHFGRNSLLYDLIPASSQVIYHTQGFFQKSLAKCRYSIHPWDRCVVLSLPHSSPMLQAYTHLLYTFSLEQKASRDEVVAKLDDAITAVRKAFPWMGAGVINESKTAESSGFYRVIPCRTPEKALIVRDLSNSFPRYEEIRAMKAPMSVLERCFTGRE
jgi:hypothetical protein